MAMSGDIPEGLSRAKSVGEMKHQEKGSLNDAISYLALVADRLGKNDSSTSEQLIEFGKEFKKAQNRYVEEQKALGVMVQSMRRAGSTESEILAFVKKNATVTMKSTQDIQDAISDTKRKLSDLVEKSEAIGGEDRLIMRQQLAMLEKSVQFQKNYADVQSELMANMHQSLEDLYTESKAKRRQDELRDRLEETRRLEDKKFQKNRDDADKKLQERREKEDKKANNKGSLFTAMLGPLRLFTDPLLKVVTKDSENTEEFIKSRLAKSLEKKREVEDEEIGERREKEDREREYIKDFESKRNELYLSTQAQLDELAGGEAALLPIFEQKLLEQETQQTEFQKYISEILPDKLGSVFKVALGPLREITDPLSSALEISSPGIDNVLTPSPAERVRRELPAPEVENILASASPDILRRELSSPGIDNVLTPSPITSFFGEDSEAQEQFITDLTDAEYNPLLEKTAPNQNALLAKGGILGASAVYLGTLLGDQLNEMTEGQDKKKGEGKLLDNVKGFLSKNGLALMKLAVPLAVMAVGGIMIKKGLDMQKRDTDDAKKYFEEGNTARGIETAWLGDRARLTEENANAELGRTTGKTALLAGGAGLVAAGGAGAIAGGTAIAGSLAGGASLLGAGGALATGGTAALAGLGAALPPALIAAAVVVGVTVIAKGTQEAFELGWDKNQASIQKELNSTIFDEDASVWEKIKASAESTWKGFTGALAGGIREAGSVLDAETMIQNEKQIKFLQEQADAGNEDYARLLDLMQSEQFKAMNKNEQKMLMQSEGLYDDYEKMQQETQKSFGEHLLTAGRTVGGFFTGLVDTTMEGMRGRETARWEAEALKGMEKMSGEDVARLKESKEYQDTMANGGDAKSAMEAAYLKEQKDMAMARGDLDKNGMVVQEGGGIKGLLAGGAAGFAMGNIPGAIGGAIAGVSPLAKYLGFGDMGAAYKNRKTGTDELDNEYRQTFEYSKRKAELMNEGKTAEEADLAVIAEQNQLYQDSLTLRLKQSEDYTETFDKVLKETKDIKKAEEAGLKAARENKKNTMTTTQLMKAKFTEVWDSVKNFAGNVSGWFKDKFSAAGQGMAELGRTIADGASAVWASITEWASGLWKGIGEKFTKVLDGLKDFGSGILDAGKEGLDWLGNKASGAWDFLTGGGRQPDAVINDGIVLKNGKIIEISPEDNVYATKNEPKVIRDQEAQAAMPSIQKTPAEFTDKNIVAMLQAILDRLNKMDIQPKVVTAGGDVNFDGLKMAGAL
jgi:hypothetical protein